MKVVTTLSVIFALWILPSTAPPILAQDTGAESSTKRDVLSQAQKTLDAIRNEDVGFLSTVVDPTGIVLGGDSSKMSAARFRKELSEKRGAYCVIFEVSCAKGDFQNSPTASSLRRLLIAQSVTTFASPVAYPNDMAVAVKKAQDANEVIFTLFFRHVGARWKLQQIEYF